MRKLVVGLLFLVCFLCRASSIGSSANFIEVPLGVPCNTGYPAVSGATCSGTATIPGMTSQVSYDAYGLASYGSLGAYAQGSITPGVTTSGTIPSYVSIASLGWFIDSFTFTGTDTCGGNPCVATGSGTIQFQFLISGTDSGNFIGQDVHGYCMDVLPGNSQTSLNCTPDVNAFFGGNTGLLTSPQFAITFGQPTTFTIGLIAFGHIGDFVDSNGGFIVDFAHTAVLSGFVVDDSTGNQLTNFSVTSGSSTVYPASTLPEPSTFLMLGTAITLFALWRRARRPN